jgi:hypothetical protein
VFSRGGNLSTAYRQLQQTLAINPTYGNDNLTQPDGKSLLALGDSFCYRQLQEQSVRNVVSALRCCQVSSIIERAVFLHLGNSFSLQQFDMTQFL